MVLKNSKIILSLGVALVALGSSALVAAPITGQVNLTGSVAVTANSIDFYGVPPGCGTPNLGSDGCFLIAAPSTGSFTTGLVVGTQGGVVKDLQNPPTPLSGSVNVAPFITFNNGIIFNLYNIPAGGGPDCSTINTSAANASCTPVIGGQVSPFTLTNSANGSNASITFSVLVNAYTGSTGTGFSPYQGVYSTQLAGQNISQILQTISTPGGSVAASYSANFVGNPIPEPGTLVTFGIGFAAMLIGGSRKFRANRS